MRLLGGAVVTFAVAGGKTASFAGGASTLTVTTNAAGQAAAAGFSPLASLSFTQQLVGQGQDTPTSAVTMVTNNWKFSGAQRAWATTPWKYARTRRAFPRTRRPG